MVNISFIFLKRFDSFSSAEKSVTIVNAVFADHLQYSILTFRKKTKSHLGINTASKKKKKKKEVK